MVVAEELEATLDLLSAALQRLDVPSALVQRFAEELRAEGYALLRGPAHMILDPWLTDALDEGAPSWVEVPEGPAAGRSIAELDLRARTGASVVAHEREGGVRANPPAELRLEAGDRLLVLAGAEAAARLRQLLADGA
jgi:CPA2 family monovalent cation:H+ antiporter-2